MNFVLIEHSNGKNTVCFDSDLQMFPKDAIAFTHYFQDEVDENGKAKFVNYRIGIPIKFVIGDMYIQLENITQNSEHNDNIYCLYYQNGKQEFCPIKSGTTLVSNYEELENAFYNELDKEIKHKQWL